MANDTQKFNNRAKCLGRFPSIADVDLKHLHERILSNFKEDTAYEKS